MDLRVYGTFFVTTINPIQRAPKPIRASIGCAVGTGIRTHGYMKQDISETQRNKNLSCAFSSHACKHALHIIRLQMTVIRMSIFITCKIKEKHKTKSVPYVPRLDTLEIRSCYNFYTNIYQTQNRKCVTGQHWLGGTLTDGQVVTCLVR